MTPMTQKPPPADLGPALFEALAGDGLDIRDVFRVDPSTHSIVLADRRFGVFSALLDGQRAGPISPKRFKGAASAQQRREYANLLTSPQRDADRLAWLSFMAHLRLETVDGLERRFRTAPTYDAAVAASRCLDDWAGGQQTLGLYSHTRSMLRRDPAFAAHYLSNWWTDHAKHAIASLQDGPPFEACLDLDGMHASLHGTECRLDGIPVPLDDWLDAVRLAKRSVVFARAQSFHSLGALELLDVVDFLNLAKRSHCKRLAPFCH